MNEICKRLIDVTLAAVGLILSAPVMGVIAFLLWIDSRKHVIFSQERLGLHGRPFRMHKFRKFPAHWGDQGRGLTAAYDARITPLGAFLERAKLDELPQLWNILKGEMSFLGPRPESLRFADLFTGKYAAILEYRPGIFGPSQVAFRNECDLYPADEDPEVYYRRTLFSQKAELDLAYFQKANCVSDLLWIIKGIWVSIVGVVDWRRSLGFHAKIVLVDLAMIETAWIFAHILRFSGWPVGRYSEVFLTGQWMVPLVLILGMIFGSCYRHPVSFFSISDAVRLVSVVSLSWLACFLMLVYVERGVGFSLLPLSWFISLPLLLLPRALRRISFEKSKNQNPHRLNCVVIYGASRGGYALASWMKSGSNGIHLIGFLDDDPKLQGTRVHGYRVLGRESDLPTVHEVHHIDEIWVTFLPDPFKRGCLKALCERNEIKLVVFPELEPFSRFNSHPS